MSILCLLDTTHMESRLYKNGTDTAPEVTGIPWRVVFSYILLRYPSARYMALFWRAMVFFARALLDTNVEYDYNLSNLLVRKKISTLPIFQISLGVVSGALMWPKICCDLRPLLLASM